MRILLLILLSILLFSSFLFSQQIRHKGTSVGLKFSTLFSNNFIENNNIDKTEDNIRYQLALKPGWSFGIMVRHDFDRLVILETGYTMVRRKYEMKITENNDTRVTELLFTSNELPVLGVAFIRITRNLYMDSSFGIVFDLFHSDNNDLDISVENNNWISPAIFAGIGYEIRTLRAGTYYLGCSYQLFLNKILDLYVYDPVPGYDPKIHLDLSANYFAVSIKYFFPFAKKQRSDN